MNFKSIYGTVGKAMANYPQELAQDAAYQSHTGCLTGLWFLPKLALGLNTNYNYMAQKLLAGSSQTAYQHLSSPSALKANIPH
jgi:hypothetical protein